MGKAIAYLFNHWESLTRFLDDVRLPPDNNRSERELRVVALGRKNFLFVGNAEAGHKLANLYTVVATSEANGVNPLNDRSRSSGGQATLSRRACSEGLSV
jgi:transposase